MEIKSDASFLKNTRCADVSTESQIDYTLPDYLGDVRGIVFSDATLRPSGRFAGGNEVEFSGIVVYRVIYLDSDGEVCSVEFTSDYDYSVKCSGESYNDSISDIRVASFSVRVTGPRRISAKANLIAGVRISETDSISVVGTALDGEGKPEVSISTKKIRLSRPSSVVEREFAESVARLDGSIADEVSVIYTGSEAHVESVEKSEDGVTLSGNMKMYSIIKNGSSPAYRAEKVVSFEENVPFDAMSEETYILPGCSVSSLRADVNADDDGCEVVMSAILEFSVVGEENQSIELTADAFFTDFPTDNGYQNFEYSTLLDVKEEKHTLSTELLREENELSDIREVLFLTATPRIEESMVEPDVIKLSGEVKYSGIATKQIDDKITYTGIKFSSPFEKNVNITCQNCDKISFETEIHATNASAVLDANKLYASCVLDIRVVVCEERCDSILSSMTKVSGEEYKTDVAKVSVYYPVKGESLFSVAKKFHASPTKIARDNGVTESAFMSDSFSEEITGVKKLIIY